jgi:hypothetical protein
MKCFQDNTPITAADALYDLFFRCLSGPDWVIVSATQDSITVPEYLKDQKVLGSVHVQDGDDNIQGPSIYVVDDGTAYGPPEAMVREILLVDSAGTGVSLKPVFEPQMGIRLVHEGPGYPES